MIPLIRLIWYLMFQGASDNLLHILRAFMRHISTVDKNTRAIFVDTASFAMNTKYGQTQIHRLKNVVTYLSTHGYNPRQIVLVTKSCLSSHNPHDSCVEYASRAVSNETGVQLLVVDSAEQEADDAMLAAVLLMRPLGWKNMSVLSLDTFSWMANVVNYQSLITNHLHISNEGLSITSVQIPYITPHNGGAQFKIGSHGPQIRPPPHMSYLRFIVVLRYRPDCLNWLAWLDPNIHCESSIFRRESITLLHGRQRRTISMWIRIVFLVPLGTPLPDQLYPNQLCPNPIVASDGDQKLKANEPYPVQKRTANDPASMPQEWQISGGLPPKRLCVKY